MLNWVFTNWASWISEWTLLLLLLLIVKLLLVATLGCIFNGLKILKFGFLVIVFVPLGGCIAWFEISLENSDVRALLLIVELLLVALLECVITDLKLLIFGLLVIVFVSQKGCIALFRVFPKPFCGSSCHESPILT